MHAPDIEERLRHTLGSGLAAHYARECDEGWDERMFMTNTLCGVKYYQGGRKPHRTGHNLSGQRRSGCDRWVSVSWSFVPSHRHPFPDHSGLCYPVMLSGE